MRKCAKCNKEFGAMDIVYLGDICNDCTTKLNVCRVCGKRLGRAVGQYLKDICIECANKPVIKKCECCAEKDAVVKISGNFCGDCMPKKKRFECLMECCSRVIKLEQENRKLSKKLLAIYELLRDVVSR